jgi:hypothetical protein
MQRANSLTISHFPNLDFITQTSIVVKKKKLKRSIYEKLGGARGLGGEKNT